MAASPFLPADIQALLDRLGEQIARGRVDAGLVEAALSALDRLPPGAAEQARPEIATHCRLFIPPVRITSIPHWIGAAFPRLAPPSHRLLLDEVPGLDRLFLFHFDGYMREAALDRLGGGARSPFFFAAIVHRLNDWAAPVRSAAARCASRVIPETEAAFVAAAALGLLGRTDSWGRWGGEALLLDEAVGRDAVAALLADSLRAATTGPMARILIHAFRRPAMDRHLLRLAREAAMPAVRALALRALLEGHASWPAGFGRKWIDKSQGLYRRIRLFDRRSVERPIPLVELLAIGAADKAAPVRRAALEALMRNHATLPGADKLLNMFLQDKSPSIRDRARFIANARAAT